MSSILHTLVERSYVWHRNIYIIWEVRTVEHRSLSALADAGSNPFSLVHRMQGLVYMMQIIERILNGKIIPVARTRHRLVEITVLYGNDIRIEEFGKFFNISFTQRIVGIISFCHEHGRTVESSMAEHHPLFEIALGCILGIELLLDKEHILFWEMRTFQRFHVTYSRQCSQLLTSHAQFCRQHLQWQDEEQQHQFQNLSFI